MKKRKKSFDDAWFVKLDSIVTGKETSTPEDDDVLRAAAKLAEALAPLSTLSTEDMQSIHAPHFQVARPSAVFVRDRKRSLLGAILTTAAVLFVLFGIVGACPANTQITNIGQHVWEAATSFEQIDASSIALLAVKDSGLRPLLPATVPENTQSIEFGIITDEADPRSFRAFTADYRIAGQDVSLYEQAANLVIPSSAAQSVLVNTYKGQVFQDTAGNSILQWYQNGMTCQMASTLSLHELLALARQFHPITQWELVV